MSVVIATSAAVAASITARANVAAAPPLTDRQRERLRLLFRAPTVDALAAAAPDISPAVADSVAALIVPSPVDHLAETPTGTG
ncbi:hypothetical protein [Mycobacterium sp.]|uniref:hypothetical protein n=1 Tax=Mycobacterium sp. TaxID=1785 RepID=UPI003F950FEE